MNSWSKWFLLLSILVYPFFTSFFSFHGLNSIFLAFTFFHHLFLPYANGNKDQKTCFCKTNIPFGSHYYHSLTFGPHSPCPLTLHPLHSLTPTHTLPRILTTPSFNFPHPPPTFTYYSFVFPLFINTKRDIDIEKEMRERERL